MAKKLSIGMLLTVGVFLLSLSNLTVVVINKALAATTTSSTATTVGNSSQTAVAQSQNYSDLPVNLSDAILNAQSKAVTSLNMAIEPSPQVTGYMPQSQATSVLGGSFPALNSSYSQFPSSTAIYQRSWTTGGPSPSFAVIIGVEVGNDSLASELLSQINGQNPVGGKAVTQSPFIVDFIPGAFGFHQKVNESSSVSFDTWIITFANSNVVFEVYLISPQAEFTQNQIGTLAQAQYQNSVAVIPVVTVPSTTLSTVSPSTVPQSAAGSSSTFNYLIILIPILLVLLGVGGYFLKLKRDHRARKKLWESRGLAHAKQIQDELTQQLKDLDSKDSTKST